MISALLLSCSTALAGESSLDLGLGQYAHRAWRFGDGFTTSPIFAIAQTPDGTLWLGTHAGLWRFDGVTAVPWRAPGGQHLPDDSIHSLLVTDDGTLWIGTAAGLVSVNSAVLTEYPALAAQDVMALLVDRQGTVWAGIESPATSTGRLCAIRANLVRCYGEDGSLGARIYCLYEDRDGHLWFVSSNGVWLWRPGEPRHYPMPDSVPGYGQALTAGTDGAVLLSGHDGLREIAGEKVRPFALPQALPQFRPLKLFTDRDGALWIGTPDVGLQYVHGGAMEFFGKAEGLSDVNVTKLFEDREGNIWVPTWRGLDEFWKVAAAVIPGEPNLSDSTVTSVLADVDGSVWFATPTGLYRRKDGKLMVYRGHAPGSEIPVRGTAQIAIREIIVTGLPADTSGSLYQDHRGRIWLGTPSGLGYLQNERFVSVPNVPGGFLYQIAEDDRGNLWVAHRKLGLLEISPDGQVKRFGWADLSIGETRCIVFDPSRRGLWLGSILGEIAFFADGRISTSYAVNSVARRAVRDLRLDPDGTLWASTPGGLIRLRNGSLATLNSKNGLPCDFVHAIADDGSGSYWLYMACGLARISRSALEAWGGSDTPGGGAQQIVPDLLLNASDGVKVTDAVWGFAPKVAKSASGRLWFASTIGAMTLDPRNLFRNALPPPVKIEKIIADGKSYDASSHLTLPPRVRDLEIDYTAASFVAPEKNLFRYKLEGHDRDWQDVGNRRQGFYSDLPPGNYRFWVVASNNSGVWNEQGAALEFNAASAYWQTNWFRAASVAAVLIVLWALYQLRLRQLAQAFNARLEERVGERTRIARDLHDTLLQSFQGLLLRFQTARELLQTRPAEAEKTLESAIEQTAQAITEGREAVQGLRASTIERNDLARAITSLAEGIAAEASSHASVELRVGVEGTPRTLHPIVRDEIYRIGNEALRNAFRHAEAKQIEVELHYDERQLRLRIRDDGKGIDTNFLTAEGREGHFGLHGMRERAKLIGGKLTVWTASKSGTEIELSVRAVHAYAASSPAWRSWFAEKFSGRARRSGHEQPSQSDSDSVD